TLTGAGRGLHAYNEQIKVVAAEPELGDLVYGLRSLEEGFIPPIFDPEQIDRKFLVNAVDSLHATRELTAREGIFAGICSGDVMLLVVACNSIEVSAIGDIATAHGIPVVGVINPGARAAIRATRNGVVGVIGTSATILTGAYARAVGSGRRAARCGLPGVRRT